MRGLVAIAVMLAGAGVAEAQRAPIEDTDYGIDLYSGAALGSVRIVGMGGTAVASSEGSAGVLVNPAFAAVRRTTSQGSWDWDWHLDGLSSFGGDLDNDGRGGDDDQVGTAGLAGMLEGWGLAVTGVWHTAELEGASGDPLEVSATTTKLAIARELADQAYTVGAAVRIGTLDVSRLGARRRALFSLPGTSLEVGGLWRPPARSWRVGAALSFPATGSQPDIAGCDPMACDGYILPARVEVPWQVAAGVAWRLAPTAWNQRVPSIYRDERALMLAADVVVTGAVGDGHGLAGFAAQELHPSGRRTSLSLRAGAEYEWLPGRLRLRGGSYWEPGRFADVGGRLHGTAGVEVSIVQFRIWRWTYRLRASATADVARDFVNAGVSAGFWH